MLFDCINGSNLNTILVRLIDNKQFNLVSNLLNCSNAKDFREDLSKTILSRNMEEIEELSKLKMRPSVSECVFSTSLNNDDNLTALKFCNGSSKRYVLTKILPEDIIMCLLHSNCRIVMSKKHKFPSEYREKFEGFKSLGAKITL